MSWTPASGQVGPEAVTLEVIDLDAAGNPRGGQALQSFTVQVEGADDHRPPVILSTPPSRSEIPYLLTPQVAANPGPTTDPALGSIAGSAYLDVNANGVRDTDGTAAYPIQLAPLGPAILDRDDDGSTDALPIGFTVPFYGTSYGDFYVNTNGNVSFKGPLAQYTPSGFPQGSPMIAPFWADVDTRNPLSGQVHLERGTSPRGNAFVQVDWSDVGYFDEKADLLDDFTLYIEDDPAGPVVAFIYRSMGWTTGDASGGEGGFGGDGAQVGFDSGDGQDFLSLGRPSSDATLAPFRDTTKLFRLGADGVPSTYTEAGADGFAIDLVAASTGQVVARQSTHSADLDGNGHIDPFAEEGLFRFEDVAPGQYLVVEEPRLGWTQTGPTPQAIPVTVVAGGSTDGLQIGDARTYLYPVEAASPDGETLTYSLPIAPEGATIDPATGALAWFPTVPGTYQFEVRVVDTSGAAATQAFTVAVADDDPDVAPVITSTAPTVAGAGLGYAYRVVAEDDNLDPLTYSLLQGPAGASISPTGGLLNWAPTTGQVGPASFEVAVDDGRGGVATQAFTVTVEPARPVAPPAFTSDPVLTAVVGQTYLYRAAAADQGHYALSFDLLAAPAGMQVQEEEGAVSWTPTADQVGIQAVRLRVRDGQGGVAEQDFQVRVLPAG